MKSFLKNLFSFKFTKKRLILAIILVITFCIIGIIVDRVYKYYETPEEKSKKYEKEIEGKIDIGNKEIIQVQKYDFNRDGIKDYVAIVGIPQNGGMNYNINNGIESYSSLDVVFINNKTKEILTYNSNKDFAGNVTFDVYEDKDMEYIFVTDNSSGNILMLMLKENELIDIISESFGDMFNGYTIEMSFDDNDKNKLNLVLDCYGKSYLSDESKMYTLDFTDKNIDLEKYRQTYNLDKFTKFELKDIDNDGRLEILAYQYSMYLFKEAENMPSNIGKITTIFKYKDGKYVFNKVNVEI